jgi:chitodextrinase
MPLYDRTCTVGCGWSVVDVWEPVQTVSPSCPQCQAPTVRAWLTTATAIIGDEIDVVQHNGTREPIHFTSKQDRARWLTANGYRELDAHVGDIGSDKSPHTTNWTQRYDAYTAENVRILLERAFTQPARPPDQPLTMHIRTFAGSFADGITHYD